VLLYFIVRVEVIEIQIWFKFKLVWNLEKIWKIKSLFISSIGRGLKLLHRPSLALVPSPVRSPTEAHHGPATAPVVGRAEEAARILPPHRSPDHRATRTASTLWPTHDCIAPTLRTRRQSKPSRTPPRRARIETEAMSRNPLCKIRTNFFDLELKLGIESA
jgi:hypothetical protein